MRRVVVSAAVTRVRVCQQPTTLRMRREKCSARELANLKKSQCDKVAAAEVRPDRGPDRDTGVADAEVAERVQAAPVPHAGIANTGTAFQIKDAQLAQAQSSQT